MTKGSAIKSKIPMLVTIVVLAAVHGYAMYDVWSYNYKGINDFINEYLFVGIPFAIMFFRYLTAKNTNALNVWLLIVLPISAFICFFGILGGPPDKSVWMLAINIMVLFVGALVSLFMGWKPAMVSQSNDENKL